MKKRILYGVGDALCIDLKNEAKCLAFGKIQNLTVNFSADSEEITGGDNPYPITEFPKSKSITVSAQDAMFDIDLMEFSQGAIKTKEKKTEMFEQIYFEVAADGTLELKHEPVESSVVINGFVKKGEPSLEENEEAVETDEKNEYSIEGKKLTFDKSLAGEIVTGYYKREVEDVTQVSGYKDKFPRPFKFVHRIPVYNDKNQIVQQMQLVIYKAKSDNSLEVNHAYQTAFAPSISIKALDPNRPDGKLWDYTIEDVDPEDASGAAFRM